MKRQNVPNIKKTLRDEMVANGRRSNGTRKKKRTERNYSRDGPGIDYDLIKALLASSLAFQALANEGLNVSDAPSLPERGIEEVCARSTSGSGDNLEPPHLPALLAAATARSNRPQLPLFETVVDNEAGGADFIEDDLSVRFKNGLGKFSSSEKSY